MHRGPSVGVWVGKRVGVRDVDGAADTLGLAVGRRVGPLSDGALLMSRRDGFGETVGPI